MTTVFSGASMSQRGGSVTPKTASAWSRAPLEERMNDQMTPTPMPEIAYGMRNGSRSQMPPRQVPGQQGEREPDADGDQESSAHPQQGVQQRADERRVLEHLDVIVETDPLGVAEAVVLGEAEERRPQQREVEEDGYQEHARGDETPGGRLVGRPPAPPGRAAGGLRETPGGPLSCGRLYDSHPDYFWSAQYLSASAWMASRNGMGSPGLALNAPNCSSATVRIGVGVASK